MRMLLALVLVLGVHTMCTAGDIANGTYSDGYVYQNGYWYLGTQAYTRASVPYTAYDHYGCLRTYYKWQYTPYTAYVQEKLPSYKDPGWRTELLRVMANRDNWVLKGRLEQIEANNYIEALVASGLKAEIKDYAPQIGYANPLRHSQVAYSLKGGNDGSTVYGYSASTIADLYGKVDPNILQHQYGRTVENAQTLAGSAASDLADLVKEQNLGQERVKALLAKGQILTQLARELETPGGTVQSRTFQFSVRQGTNGQWQVDQMDQPGHVGDSASLDSVYQQAAVTLVKTKCESCHSGNKPAGGIPLTNPLGLDAPTKKLMYDAVHNPDEAHRMPLGPNNTVGVPLTRKELAVFDYVFGGAQ